MEFGYEVKNDVSGMPKEKFFVGIMTALYVHNIINI
jgi:hypothetical protein